MASCRRGPARRRALVGSSTAQFDAGSLAGAKGDRRISVCIPARNEAATVGPIVQAIIVDTDRSARWGAPGRRGPGRRRRFGRPDRRGGPQGRRPGRRLRCGRAAARDRPCGPASRQVEGDLVVFVDADVTNFDPHFVTGLLGPLLADESLALVKGHYRRPLHGAPDGGGRVTELMARPVIDLLFPHLSSIDSRWPARPPLRAGCSRSAASPTGTPWNWRC